MSLKSLLEMEDLSQPVGQNENNSGLPKPKPRPRPRARGSKMLSPATSKKGEDADVDDVISITSVDSVNNNKLGGKDSRYSPSSKSKRTRFRSQTTSAFDNAAFVSDEDEQVLEKSEKAFRPKPRKRNSLVGSPTSPSKRISKVKGSYEASSRDDEDLDKNGNDIVESFNDKDEDDAPSDATFTVENEKYRDSGPLSKKPPKPTSSPRLSKIPRLPQRKSEKEGSTMLKHEGKKKVEITARKKPHKDAPKHSDSSDQKPPEYLAVEMGDDDADPDGDGNEDKKVGDESETASVSSSVLPPNDKIKNTKKSRFGKLFGGSSSSDTKKAKNVLPDKGIAKLVEEDESKPAPVAKQSLVHRWRKSAKTFLKTPAKPIDEEAGEEAEPDGDAESKSSKIYPTSQKSRKSTDTRIFMPESGSEAEDSANSEDETKTKSAVAKETDTKAGEDEAPIDKDNSKAKSEQKKSRYKSFANLLRTKSSEKEQQTSKSKDDNVDNDDIRKESEEVAKKPAKPKVKEAKKPTKPQVKETKKLSTEQKRDARAQKPSSVPREDIKISESSSSDELENEVESESEVESGTELPTRKAKTPPSKRKQATKTAEALPLVDAASGRELLFGLTVHSSDLLPLDPHVIHPVVKVTAMLQNGQYMKRISPDENTSPFKSYPDSQNETKSDRKARQRRLKKLGIFEMTENVAESILPIMSQPCQARHSIPTFAPTWNELLVFEEPIRRFVTRKEPKSNSEDDPILLFELMDFLPMNNGHSGSVSGFHGTDKGWYKVAWAFLKPIGGNGVMNVNKKLRLQLYKPVKLRSKEKLDGPEVFSWWKCGRREKVNATLYITPKGILPPETRTASLRQLLLMRKEHLTQAILDSQLATRKKKGKLQRPSLYELREQANWSRMEGQSCKPPNKLVASLPSSQIESLNIVISGNVHCTKFSPCGYKLAAGLDTDELHVILIFEVPSWTLLKSLKGHHGIIYDITWKLFELDDHTSYHYMASASADSTVRIWKMDNHDEKTLSLFKILYHPSYVYTVRFHPTHPSLLASGCFDGIIRIWDIKPEHALDLAERKKKRRKQDMKHDEGGPPGGQISCEDWIWRFDSLDRHNSFVNSIVFDLAGQYLYSGDGSSYLFKWSCSSPTLRKSWKLERDAKLHPGEVPINSIDLHPSGNRILLHLRDNFIKILDADSFIPLQTFSGLNNERFQIRSCFSPCGNLVISGSEQNMLCIWDADTGKILKFINPRSYPQCTVTSVDYHPFDYYIAAGLASAISEPSPVLVYMHHQPTKMNYPLLKKTAMKMRESLEKSRSQSQEPEGNELDQNGTSLLAAKRGASSEKFVSIIQKLDSALYFAQQRNKRRETEAKASGCTSSILKKDDENESALVQRLPSQSKSIETAAFTGSKSPSSSVRYAKRQVDRPRSASSSRKERYARAKEENNLQRDIKSDSEQSYQLKIQPGSPRRMYDDNANVDVKKKTMYFEKKARKLANEIRNSPKEKYYGE